MAAMPRGGKREGAGKKPLLEQDTRDLIGQACEIAWRALKEKNYREAVSAEQSPHELVEDAETLRSIPLRHRAEIIRLADLPHDERTATLASRIDDMPQDQADLWIEWVGSLVNRRATLFDIGQLMHSQRTTPQGEREVVLAAVAAQATADYGLDIKPSLVSACWDEYRAFEAEVRRDVFGPKDDSV